VLERVHLLPMVPEQDVPVLYAATDVFDERWEPFRLFGMGRTRGIENVVYGQFEGADVRAFDYWYREGADRDGAAQVAFEAPPPGLAAWIGLTRRFSGRRRPRVVPEARGQAEAAPRPRGGHRGHASAARVRAVQAKVPCPV